MVVNNICTVKVISPNFRDNNEFKLTININ